MEICFKVQSLEATLTLGHIVCIWTWERKEALFSEKKPLPPTHKARGGRKLLQYKCLSFFTSLHTQPPPHPYIAALRNTSAFRQHSCFCFSCLSSTFGESNKFGLTRTGSHHGICIEPVKSRPRWLLMDQWGSCVVGVWLWDEPCLFLKGEVPSGLSAVKLCVFCDRCEFAQISSSAAQGYSHWLEVFSVSR